MSHVPQTTAGPLQRPARLTTVPGRVRIARPAYERILEEAIVSHQEHLETGGVLFGYGNAASGFFMVHATGPGRNARRTPVSFQLDVRFLEQFSRRASQLYGATTVMQWHLHPGNLDHPSGTDDEAVAAQLAAMPLSQDHFCVLILTFWDGRPKLSAYLYWRQSFGRLEKYQLDVEIVDLMPTGLADKPSFVFDYSQQLDDEAFASLQSARTRWAQFEPDPSDKPTRTPSHAANSKDSFWKDRDEKRPKSSRQNYTWLVRELDHFQEVGIAVEVRDYPDGALLVRTLDAGPRDVIAFFPTGGPDEMIVLSVNPKDDDDLREIPGLPKDSPLFLTVFNALRSLRQARPLYWPAGKERSTREEQIQSGAESLPEPANDPEEAAPPTRGFWKLLGWLTGRPQDVSRQRLSQPGESLNAGGRNSSSRAK